MVGVCVTVGVGVSVGVAVTVGVGVRVGVFVGGKDVGVSVFSYLIIPPGSQELSKSIIIANKLINLIFKAADISEFSIDFPPGSRRLIL
jgi:hypothetical protein